MKIKKFNESINALDFDYIKECFIELLDDDQLNSEIVDSEIVDEGSYICLGFDLPIGRFGEYYEVDSLVNIGDRLNTFFSALYSSVEKVKLQYPEIYIQVLHDEYGQGNTTILKYRGLQYITVNISTTDDF